MLEDGALAERLADVAVRLSVEEDAGHAQHSQIGRRLQNAEQMSGLEKVPAFVVLLEEEAKLLKFAQTGLAQWLFGAEEVDGEV